MKQEEEIKSFEIKLKIDDTQLDVLRDIVGFIDIVNKQLINKIPHSFPRQADGYIEKIIYALEALQFLWKEWALEGFKREMGSNQFFKDIKLERQSPWGCDYD